MRWGLDGRIIETKATGRNMVRSDRLYVSNVVKSMEERIKLTRLDLRGFAVLTEAATGAYAVTPVIAAMAGAREVVAFTRGSRFGPVEQVIAETNRLVRAVGSALPVTVVSRISPTEYSRFDIVTNSGHLRPITREHVMHMKTTAVIPLMYESWELRKSDVDLQACRERGIKTAGTNEHNDLLDVFAFLGPLVVHALHNASVPVVGSRIAVVSNNAFGAPVVGHLLRNHAEVFCIGPKECFDEIDEAVLCGDFPTVELARHVDACVVATTPSVSSELTYDRYALTEFLGELCPATCIHLWGDIDHKALVQSGIVMVPSGPVPDGHQGLAMGAVGPEPIIRLITGGLKVGEILVKKSESKVDLEFCQMIS